MYGYGSVYLGTTRKALPRPTSPTNAAAVATATGTTALDATVPLSLSTSTSERTFARAMPAEPVLASEKEAARPRFSNGALHRQRRDQNKADISYDIDGDGVVGQRDMYLSTRFDADYDGVLSEQEREALIQGTVTTAHGRGVANSMVNEDLQDVVAEGGLPPRSAMLASRAASTRAEAAALGDLQERRINERHAEFQDNIQNTYPWVKKPALDWGRSEPLDKITSNWQEEESYNNADFHVFPVRGPNPDWATTSSQIGAQGYTRVSPEEWHSRQRHAKGKLYSSDNNTRVLAMTQNRVAPTWTETYANVIGRPGGPAYALPTKEWRTTNRETNERTFTSHGRGRERQGNGVQGRAVTAMPQHRYNGQALNGAGRTSLNYMEEGGGAPLPNPYKEAKSKWGGTGVIRAQHARYGRPEFNNGNRLIDNVVGHSKFTAPHYLPANPQATFLESAH